MIPGQGWAVLTPDSRSDFAFTSAGGTKTLVHFLGGDKFTYTGFAGVHDSQSALGEFVYGVATPASSVPITGMASYTADLSGSGGAYTLGGSAKLEFDFARGALSGSLTLEGNDPAGWGPYTLGKYDFTRTVYSTGSPSFSGDLSSASTNGLGGSFSGIFTGPAAQELMGKWQLQFRDFYEPSQTVTGTGVMAGRQ
jgi:hypothetical protein